MRLDYGSQLSPYPLELSIGTLVKPKLSDIAKITFDKFNYFEVLITLTPELFFSGFADDMGKEYWSKLSDDEKSGINIYDIIIGNDALKDLFLEIFNFFFQQTVIFREGYFVILDTLETEIFDLEEVDIKGVISKDNISEVLNVLAQICCINEDNDEEQNVKFKNSLAEKLFKRMKAAKKAEKKKNDKNYTIPNLISAVSNRHPSITPTSVWDLTVFQLIDSFQRLQTNSIYDIDVTRVSVWGDEKKTFDAALWYKNQYESNSQLN